MDNNANDGSFIPYPTNHVIGTAADAEHARAAIEALLGAGFSREDITVLHGEGDVQQLDPTGAEHGFLAQVQRTLIRTAAPVEEYKHLKNHVDDLRAGRFVVMVHTQRREQRMVAADILNEHGAEFIGFYGRWAWQALTPDLIEPAAAEAAAGTGPAATRPDEIPLLFADAWNKRDPDSLASLFDDDAEFVNVTGLWWHNRASIREAHAYGLERIFNASRLTIGDTRVKWLSKNVAVVHARMTVNNQTSVGGIKQPGPRTTIFSFVARQTDDGWKCASAHNTDIVPNMETNVIDENGMLRAANYRSGQVS